MYLDNSFYGFIERLYLTRNLHVTNYLYFIPKSITLHIFLTYKKIKVSLRKQPKFYKKVQFKSKNE